MSRERVRAPGEPRASCITFLIVLLVFVPTDAAADVGIPMLVWAWPISWVALIPIIVIEGAFARRILSLSWKESLILSTKANLWSTLVGIPVAWVLSFAAELALGIGVYKIGVGDKIPDFLAFVFSAAWLGPTEKTWVVYAAGAVLCLPFWVASTYVETLVADRRLGRERHAKVVRWSRQANGFTYGLAATVLAVLAVLNGAARK